VDPRAGLDDMEKRKFLTLPGLELRPLSRPVRSQVLFSQNILRDRASKQAKAVSFHTVPNSLFTNHPTIRRLVVQVTDSVFK
jgi:hypothetical protein